MTEMTEMTGTTDNVLLEDRDGVALVTLNRPAALNAIDAPTRAAFIAAMRAADADEKVRAVVITGAGDKAFSAGQDVAELGPFDAEMAAAWIRDLGAMYQSIRRCAKPVVAAVNGLAVGAGLQIALHADVAIGHDGVRMAQGEVKVGIPSVLGPWVMREAMGLGATAEMSLSGRLVEADECLRLGLLHRLVAREAVEDTAFETARALAGAPPVALALSKQWLAELPGKTFEETIEAAADYARQAFATGEPQARTRAFLEKKAQRG